MKARKKADSQKLDAVNAALVSVEAGLVSLEQDMDVWRNDIATATAAIDHLSELASAAEKDAVEFAPTIKELESGLATEMSVIDSAFKGNKAKYAAKALPGASSIEDREERVGFLNRLLFLDPKSKVVQKRLEAAIKG
jgi:predicted  nucleic acid-binding Zn-ribbon protein